ncbi:MAG: tetraacyldisaccharide 4'-kinase [Alphaproteobacteria bacterium]|nr:tetraacyldisaccharide 4'-kinase [Alphaproteobacteria bacterium]
MRAPAFWGPPADRFSLAATVLAPAAWVYGSAHRLRWRMAKPKRASVPVVCVGNLVAGGAGKTPTAIAVARYLRAQGAAVHFITRGYGGNAVGPIRVDLGHHDARLVGDEALLLARIAPTWVARDRAAAAERATAAGASMLVLDDGFQNPGLAKDVSLVVVDAAYGFGNGRLLPAGPLRERAADGLGRATAAVVIGGAAPFTASIPILAAEIEATPESRARLANRPVVSFAGIARPEKFFALLTAIGCKVVATHAFGDHHRFSVAEIAGLRAEAARANATLVTTAKDAVRLDGASGIEVLDVALSFGSRAALDHILGAIVH